MSGPLCDLILQLIAETTELDASAMTVIDAQEPRVRAAAALVLFCGLNREQKLDVARRCEEIEKAMMWHSA